MRQFFFGALALAVLTAPAAAQSQINDPANRSSLQPPQDQIWQLQNSVTTLQALVGDLTKHRWPALTDQEKAALAAVLKTLPKSTKFDIICNTASCDDLAEDIDDALEAAGLSSSLDHAAGPLGYGIAAMVSAFDKPAAQTAIAALKAATGGKLDPALLIAKAGQNPRGYVTILIGKHKDQEQAR